jgi:hypothetical protein
LNRTIVVLSALTDISSRCSLGHPACDDITYLRTCLSAAKPYHQRSPAPDNVHYGAYEVDRGDSTPHCGQMNANEKDIKIYDLFFIKSILIHLLKNKKFTLRHVRFCCFDTLFHLKFNYSQLKQIFKSYDVEEKHVRKPKLWKNDTHIVRMACFFSE